MLPLSYSTRENKGFHVLIPTNGLNSFFILKGPDISSIHFLSLPLAEWPISPIHFISEKKGFIIFYYIFYPAFALSERTASPYLCGQGLCYGG